MTKEEWVEYFRAVYGRTPEPAEYMAALEKGEFTVVRTEQQAVQAHFAPVQEPQVVSSAMMTVSPANPKGTRKSTSWLVTIVTVLLLVGAYVGYRVYYQGNIDGVWVATKLIYYNEGSEEWVTDNFKDSQIVSGIIVEKGQLTTVAYTKEDESSVGYRMQYSVKPWSQELQLNMTKKEYIHQWQDVNSEDSEEEAKKDYIKIASFKRKYAKEGNTLTWTAYKDGEFRSKTIFKKLSKKDGRKLYEVFYE